MASIITRSIIAANEKSPDQSGATLLLQKYRIRVLPASEIPLFEDVTWFGEQNPEVIVVDMPKPKSEEMQFESDFDGIAMDDSSCDEDYGDFGGGPLEVSFLTLDKLDKGNKTASLTADTMLARCGVSARPFESTPIPTQEAVNLKQFLMRNKELSSLVDPSLVQLPVFIVASSDGPYGGVLFGSKLTKKILQCYLTKCLGPANADVIAELRKNVNLFSGMQSKSTASALYNVIAEVKNRKKRDFVSGKMDIVFRWTSSPIDFLQTPPPSAQGIFRFAPGWKDERMAANVTTVELELLMNLCDALTTSDVKRVKWRATESGNSDEKIIAAVNKVIEQCSGVAKIDVDHEQNREHRFFDITEELWCVLRLCSSYGQLVRGLRTVFDSLSTGVASAIVHADNRTFLARLVRDASTGDLMLPRLEALTPIQILAEIAAEKIRRDLTYTFVGHKFLRDEADAVHYIHASHKPTAPVEERARGLIPVHLALQTMLEINKHLCFDGMRLVSMTKSVLLKFTQHPSDTVREVVFETEIRKVDVQQTVLDTIKPFVCTTETWWTAGARQIYSMAHFTRQPRFEHLENRQFKEDYGEEDEKMEDDGAPAKRTKLDPNLQYLCTLTTMTTHDRAQLRAYSQ